MPSPVQTTIDNNELVVRIPLNREPYPESSSGKTLLVASTGGNVRTGIMVPIGNGSTREVVIGLNAYVYKDPK